MQITYDMNVVFNTIYSEKLAVFTFQNTPDIFEKFIIPGVVKYFFTVFGMKGNVVKDLSVAGHRGEIKG